MKILVLNSYGVQQRDRPDNWIRSADFESSDAHLESRIEEQSVYSVPAGEMFIGPSHTQLREGLNQIRAHEQYGETTLDLYFPWYVYRVDRQRIPVSENDHIVHFDILPGSRNYDVSGFLESMVALIEGYDLVFSILRREDIVRLRCIFEVDRATTLIFLLAKSHKHVVNEGLPNLHVVKTGSDLANQLDGATGYNLKGFVLKKLCEAACRDGFQVFEQVKQDPQQLIEIVQNQ